LKKDGEGEDEVIQEEQEKVIIKEKKRRDKLLTRVFFNFVGQRTILVVL